MSSGLFKDIIYKMCLEIIYLMYMYKKALALNDLQWLYAINPNQTYWDCLNKLLSLTFAFA